MSNIFGNSVKGELLQLAADIHASEKNVTMPYLSEGVTFYWEAPPDPLGEGLQVALAADDSRGTVTALRFVVFNLSERGEKLQVVNQEDENNFDGDPLAEHVLEEGRATFEAHDHFFCVESFRRYRSLGIIPDRFKQSVSVPETKIYRLRSAKTGQIISK